jgi:hypothetical protein
VKGACLVPRVEAVEIVDLTKVIDGALVSILATLENDHISREVAMDLTVIASASLYVRDQMGQALAHAKAAAIDVAEAEASS